MDKSTVKFALSVLDSQWERLMKYGIVGSKTLYEGALEMAEIFVSQAHGTQVGILTPTDSGRDGKHCVLYANGKKLFADDET